MDAQQMMMMLPGLQPDELIMIQNATKDMSENQQQQFFTLYQGKRKDPQTLTILTIIGFLGIAGIQRFVTGDTGMGVLYLLTGGLCCIGTIVDLVNIKKLASEFNQKQIVMTVNMVKMMTPR
ncbi:MAG TPA: TM2 domain-containing protein [Chitinophagaceae bacterium]|nr:TM2 domain-containing protein [Chitinophagaceae bacterium]